ncbi:MAG TPA: HIT family protein [Gaiellaceae bacterium]|nr:HIT family protein [Gaiellaceae bacterium]
MSDCVFCGIERGEIEGSRVYADERVIAFLDIRPVTRGHTLVVPRAHGASLAELAPDDGAAMFRGAMVVAEALRRSGLPCEGVTLWLADGEAAGQDVFHAHLHVIPRYEGDGFGLRLPPDYREHERAELNETAERIREVV